MHLEILSHAGLAVTAGSAQLVCDPWIVGSTYWRSWWNYPPPPPDLLNRLRPSHIYLTHIHWDHFQAVTLLKFPPPTPILIPKAPSRRMLDDVLGLGFANVTELAHAQTVKLDTGFTLTPYHFGPFLDSAVVLEVDGVTILNANDAKLMGRPLEQLLDRHPHIDFVLRSHSSANSRSSYVVTDAAEEAVDDATNYVADFTAFASAVGARYAIPFASNHCHLHREVWEFNSLITTPIMVRDHFERQRIDSPELVVMAPGDTWSTEAGFRIAAQDWFSRRAAHLQEYRRRHAHALEQQDRLEADAAIDWLKVEEYFSRLRAATPGLLRRTFRRKTILYVLTAGARTELVEVGLHEGTVRNVDAYTDNSHPRQIHTSVHIFMHCITSNLFSHLSISKRVRYRVPSAARRDMERWNLLFNLYEYDWIPLRRIMTFRFVACWMRRWRECVLYAHVAWNRLLGRRFKYADHLPRGSKPRGHADPHASRQRGRRALGAIALVCASLLFMLAVLELVTRAFVSVPQVGPVFTTYVPDLGLWNKSDFRCTRVAPEYRTTVTTNRLGLRGPDPAAEPRSGKRRLLCVGDSFTFGKGVDDAATYAANLEQLINERGGERGWEVLNAGVVSFSTANAYQYLQKRGLALRPDAVVLQVFWNDFKENVDCGLFSLDAASGDLVATPDAYARLRRMVRLYDAIPGRSLLDQSYFFNFVRLRLNLAVLWSERRRPSSTPIRADRSSQEDALARVLFAKAGVLCKEAHLPLFVLVFDVPAPRVALIRDAISPTGARVLDLADLRARHPDFYYPIDGHWNPTGHRYAAQRLASFLEDAGVLGVETTRDGPSHSARHADDGGRTLRTRLPSPR